MTRGTLATWVFRLSGIYGLVVMLPQYFLETQVGLDPPPAITHPEFFYGFIGVVVTFQIVFLIIARDPVRFRILMLPSVVEKWSFALAVAALALQGRLGGPLLIFGGIDAVLGLLFLISWLSLKPEADGQRA
ncbi:MAG: hypothetical protein MUE68_05565 [Bacteroidetes bacterium]|jgi:hypothetical protein|nr:hypothetical protein [Bacteroidota bacterium]